MLGDFNIHADALQDKTAQDFAASMTDPLRFCLHTLGQHMLDGVLFKHMLEYGDLKLGEFKLFPFHGWITFECVKKQHRTVKLSSFYCDEINMKMHIVLLRNPFSWGWQRHFKKAQSSLNKTTLLLTKSLHIRWCLS